MLVNPERMMPVSLANSVGVSKLASEAEQGNDTLLLRGGKPTAFVVSYEKYRDLVDHEVLTQNMLMALQGVMRSVATSRRAPRPLDEVLRDAGVGAAAEG